MTQIKNEGHNLCYGKGNKLDLCWNCRVICDCAIKQGKTITEIGKLAPDIIKRQDILRSPLYKNANNPVMPDIMISR